MSTTATTTFFKKYKILQKIGEGTFSEVLKCLDRSTGVPYAAKRLKKIYHSFSEILNSPELVAMRKITPHPNVLYVIESHYDPIPGRITLIFELMDMSLYDLIKGRKCRIIVEQKVKLYFYQLLKGLDHIHTHGIFHRDLKPENILIKGDNVKIGDLGSIKEIYSKPPYTEYISTRWYRPPECLLTTGHYGPQMDIWAIGCVFYELLTLKPLFPGSNELDQISKIHTILGPPSSKLIAKFRRYKSRNCSYVFSDEEGIGVSNLISNVSESAVELLELMLVYDPEKRPKAKDLLHHDYFANLREISKRNSVDYWRYPLLLNYLNFDRNYKHKRFYNHRLKSINEIVSNVPKTTNFNSYSSLVKKLSTDDELNSTLYPKRNSKTSWTSKNSDSSKHRKFFSDEIKQITSSKYNLTSIKNNDYLKLKENELNFLPEINKKTTERQSVFNTQINQIDRNKRKVKLPIITESQLTFDYSVTSSNLTSPVKKKFREVSSSTNKKTTTLNVIKKSFKT